MSYETKTYRFLITLLSDRLKVYIAVLTIVFVLCRKILPDAIHGAGYDLPQNIYKQSVRAILASVAWRCGGQVADLYGIRELIYRLTNLPRKKKQ